MKVYFEEITVETVQNNLQTLDAKLQPFIGEYDCFCVEGLTQKFREIVQKSGIRDGILSAQVLHTTCVLSVNELDEPMLLGDISRQMQQDIPRVGDYLHNSKLRTVNLCEGDYKCDRNADAHIKAFLIGNHSLSLLVKDGGMVLGRWQRVALIDFDGPRERKLLVQVLG